MKGIWVISEEECLNFEWGLWTKNRIEYFFFFFSPGGLCAEERSSVSEARRWTKSPMTDVGILAI